MNISTVSKLLTYLIIYYLLLVVLIGIFGNSIEDDIAHIFLLYGIPLLLICIFYLISVTFEISDYLKTKNMQFNKVIITSFKMAIAILPMFFLNNSLGNLLAILRLK